jgi:hypothetical protein
LFEARVVGFWFGADEKVEPIEVGQQTSSYQFSQSSLDAVALDNLAPVLGNDDSHPWML